MQAPRPPETFETHRLTLRPVTKSDAASIFAYASDPEVTRFLTFPRHESTSVSEQWAQRCAGCWHEGNAFPWAIIEREGSEFLGLIELRIDLPKASFGYVFNQRAWGRGYATEAASTVVDWAISQPTIFRVWSTCHPENIRSARVLQKSGLRLEGRFENWGAWPNLDEPAGAGLVYARIRAVGSSPTPGPMAGPLQA
jgi:ribosomal-protein-alanine N-acetyltransferase